MSTRRSFSPGSLPQLLRYRSFRRVLMVCAAILAVLTALIGLMFYAVFSRYAGDQTRQYASGMMSQRVYATRLLWEEMDALSATMRADPDVRTFLLQRTEDKVVNYRAFSRLGDYKVLYPFIRNISVVNLGCDIRVSLLYYVDDRALFRDSDGAACMTRVLGSGRERSPDAPVLTFLFPIQYYSSDVAGGILIDIDQAHLHSLLGRDDSGSPVAAAAIIDRQGQAVTHTGPQADLLLSLPGLVDAIGGDEASQGTLIRTVDGVRYLVSYCAGPVQGWYVVDMQPAAPLMSAAYRIIWLALATLLALLAAGLITAFLATRRVYRPLQTLIERVADPPESAIDDLAVLSDSITSMQRETDRMALSLQQSRLLDILHGRAPASALPEALRAPSHAVALLTRIDAGAQTADARVESLARESLSGLCDGVCVRWADGVWTLLLPLRNAAAAERLPAALESLVADGRRQLHAELRCALSDATTEANGIREACEQAQRIAQFYFFRPDAPVLTAECLPPDGPAHLSIDGVAQALQAAVLASDEAAARAAVDDFLARAASGTPYACRQAAAALLLQVEAALPELGGANPEGAVAACTGAETCRLLEQRLNEALRSLMEAAAHSESARALQRNRQIIQRVCGYVDTSYADPELSLNAAADQVRLSAGYLGRLFKQTQGVSFNEYLTDVRLKRAGGMLRETDLPVAAIAEAVGLGNNPSYFSALFKKAYGVSPSAFRGAAQRDQGPDAP